MSNNLSEVSLEVAVDARMPVMLVGSPGTSKTAMVNALAERMGYEVIPIILSRMAETDVTGFPTKGEYNDNGSSKPMTEYAPQYWQVTALQKKKVFLFFDEYSNAQPDVRASALTIMQDRVFPNGDKFPEETVIVGAMNPTDTAADGYDLDPATSNRMMFLNWRPSTESWLNGMPDNWGRGVKSEGERKWRDFIVRFIKDNPGSLHNEGTDVNSTEAHGIDQGDSSAMAVLQYAWASRRSWDNLSRILGTLHDKGIKDVSVEDEIIAGTVGYAECNRFRDWLRKNSALNVKDIIANPTGFNGWESIVQDDANLILRSAIDSLKDNSKKSMSSKHVQNVLQIFKEFQRVDRGSLAAGFLEELTSSIPKLKGKVAPEEFAIVKQDALDTLKQYHSIFDQRQSRPKAK